MYHSLRREFYWLNMALDTHECVRNFSRCAKERINLKAHSQFLKLFPASRPLEFVAIDILGHLTKTAQGNRFLLVMSDRYSSKSSYRVARAFCEHWVFVYGPPSYLLSNSGGQFTAKFFQHVCNILGIRKLYTTTYHRQTNGQVERFNRTILAGLRKYVQEERQKWDLFSHAVTYAYNTRTHSSTGFSPFELVLSRAPASLVIGNSATVPLEEETVKSVKNLFAVRLRKMLERADKNLRKAQERYKRNFDARVSPDPHTLVAGDQVFLRSAPSLQVQRPADNSAHENERGGISHNLKSKAIGPFEVVRASSHTVTIIQDNNTEEVVSRDRVVLAPASLKNRTSAIAWKSAPEPARQQEMPTTERDFPELPVPPEAAGPTSAKVTSHPFVGASCGAHIQRTITGESPCQIPQ